MSKDKFKLNSIESAIKDIRDGKIVIVVDDKNRENEGDFLASAELVTRLTCIPKYIPWVK